MRKTSVLDLIVYVQALFLLSLFHAVLGMVGRGGKGKEMEGRDSISAVWLTGEKRKQRISYSHILPGPHFPICPNWAEMERKVKWEKLYCPHGRQVM